MTRLAAWAMPVVVLVNSLSRSVVLGVTLNIVLTLILRSLLTLALTRLVIVTIGPLRCPVALVMLVGAPLNPARKLTEFLLANIMLVYRVVVLSLDRLTMTVTFGWNLVPRKFPSVVLTLLVVLVFGMLPMVMLSRSLTIRVKRVRVVLNAVILLPDVFPRGLNMVSVLAGLASGPAML